MDTIKVSVGSDGRYIYSDSKQISKAFGSLTKRFQPAKGKEDAKLKLLFDLSTNFMLMHVTISKSVVAAHVEMSQFLGKNTIDSTVVRTLKATPILRKVNIKGKSYRLFAVAPEHEPDDVMYLAFDENYPVDYQKYFNGFMSMALGEFVEIDLPLGAPVYAEDKNGEIMLELISIEKDHKEGLLNLELNFE